MRVPRLLWCHRAFGSPLGSVPTSVPTAWCPQQTLCLPGLLRPVTRPRPSCATAGLPRASANPAVLPAAGGNSRADKTRPCFSQFSRLTCSPELGQPHTISEAGLHARLLASSPHLPAGRAGAGLCRAPRWGPWGWSWALPWGIGSPEAALPAGGEADPWHLGTGRFFVAITTATPPSLCREHGAERGARAQPRFFLRSLSSWGWIQLRILSRV